jgi:hypothetical protein
LAPAFRADTALSFPRPALLAAIAAANPDGSLFRRLNVISFSFKPLKQEKPSHDTDETLHK